MDLSIVRHALIMTSRKQQQEESPYRLISTTLSPLTFVVAA
jgi:hypothetical protein